MPAPTTPPRMKLSTQSQWFFLAILIGMLALTWMVFRPFIIYMVTGVFVAVLALPIDKRWERILPNRLAAIMTILTLLVLVTAPLAGLGWSLYRDVGDVAQDISAGSLDKWADRALSVAEPWLPEQTAAERNATIDRMVDAVEKQAINILRAVGESLLSALSLFAIAVTVILFVTYYILTDGERLVKYLRRAAPLPPRQVDYLFSEAGRGLRAVFVGQILTSLIQGMVGGIGFLIVGLPGVVLWSALMAVLALLPVVGAFLVWLPAGIYLLVAGKIWQGLFILAYGILVISNVDNIIRPILIGRGSGVHPIFILLGVLGGVAAFGFIGLFLGPVIVGITISVLKVWENEYLDPSNLRDEVLLEPSKSPEQTKL